MRGQRDYLAARVLELEQEADAAAKERKELLSKLERAGGGSADSDATKLKIRVVELEGSNKLLATKVQETEMKLENARTETENLKMEVEKVCALLIRKRGPLGASADMGLNLRPLSRSSSLRPK